MAITPWIHYADLPLAPIYRSRPGSNVPVGDTGQPRLVGDLGRLLVSHRSCPAVSSRNFAIPGLVSPAAGRSIRPTPVSRQTESRAGKSDPQPRL